MGDQAKAKLTRSSGNVFRDLGFPRDEAERLLARADLMIATEKELRTRGLKQAKAAQLLDAQPLTSDRLDPERDGGRPVVDPAARRRQ